MPKSLLGPALVVACAVTSWSCEGVSPSSPSSVIRSTSATIRPFDEAPAPAPDPAAAPPPPATTVYIVGADGPVAYAPNPIAAAVGDTVVFANGDTVLHHIVLDDGQDAGDVLPGQSSTVAVAITTATPMGFHCTIHPAMIGSINGEMPPPSAQAPDEPVAAPDPPASGSSR